MDLSLQINLTTKIDKEYLDTISQYAEKLGNTLTAEHVIEIILKISCFMAQECTS